MTEPECRHDSATADRKVIHDVNTHGWHVVLVSPESGHSGWAFSIGLFHTFRHPEILIFGLDSDVMHRIINAIGERARGGALTRADTVDPDLLDGYACSFKTVERIWYPLVLGYARWFYGGDDFPALQCVWPDKAHQFPWQSGFAQELVPLQPLLFHADARTARAEKLIESMRDAKSDEGST